MNDNQKKIYCAAILIVVWFLLVLNKLTPVQPFIDLIRDVLVGLGIYHTALKDPKS